MQRIEMTEEKETHKGDTVAKALGNPAVGSPLPWKPHVACVSAGGGGGPQGFSVTPRDHGILFLLPGKGPGSLQTGLPTNFSSAQFQRRTPTRLYFPVI